MDDMRRTPKSYVLEGFTQPLHSSYLISVVAVVAGRCHLLEMYITKQQGEWRGKKTNTKVENISQEIQEVFMAGTVVEKPNEQVLININHSKKQNQKRIVIFYF